MMRSARHSRAVAAAGDYADNDIISNSATNGAGTAWTFARIGQGGHPFEIARALLTVTGDAVVAGSRLHLFRANPSASELDDNAALAIHADDVAKYLGFIDFPALVDMGGFAASQVSPSFPCDTGDGGHTLYGILQITDAETNEVAGMTVAITLWAKDR